MRRVKYYLNRVSVVLLAALFFSSQQAVGQFAIGTTGTPLGTSEGSSVIVDNDGNVYATGHFRRSVDFDPSANVFELTASGISDAFVASYDALGNFRWAFSVSGEGDDLGYSIDMDDDQNIYIAGEFQGQNVDFDPGIVEAAYSSIGTSTAAFVASYDRDGNYRFAHVFDGALDVKAMDSGVDSAGNIYVVGRFEGIVDFDPGPESFEVESSGFWDGFLASIDPAGGVRYAYAFEAYPIAVAVEGNGNSTITGYYIGDADLISGVVLDAISIDRTDAFVASFSTTGSLRYAFPFGGGNSDVGKRIAIDGNGNIYVTGYFENDVDLDPGPGEAIVSAVAGEDIFLASYDSSGVYRFGISMGTGGHQRGHDVAVDGSGVTFVTGYFTGTVDFDPGSTSFELTAPNTPPYHEAFLASYDDTGALRYARRMGGLADDSGQGIGINENGLTCVTGYFQDRADFNPGDRDLFLVAAPFAGDECFIACYDAAGELSSAFTQFVHAAPDVDLDSIDIYVNGDRVVSGLPYGEATSPVFLPTELELGVAKGGTDVLAETDVTIPLSLVPGNESVAVVIGTLEPAATTDSLNVLVIDTGQSLGKDASGESSAFVHATVGAPVIDVFDQSALLVDGLSYGDYRNTPIEPAAYEFEVRRATDGFVYGTFGVDLTDSEEEIITFILTGYETPPPGVSDRNMQLLVSGFAEGSWPAGVVTGAERETTQSELRLLGNYPNPFNESTTVAVELPYPAAVSVEVYDVTGRLMLTSESTYLSARDRSISISLVGKPAGLYLYRVRAETSNGISCARGTMIKLTN